MTSIPVTKPWIANGPEDRLSIAFNRFLDDCLLRPRYFTANNDSDHGGRTAQQRMRDANRGRKSGQLDFECEQGPPHLFRRVELKRGENGPTDGQLNTIAILTECGAKPIVAWTLWEAFCGMELAGFRFTDNVMTKLQFYEEQLAAWDREAELVKGGAVVKKRSVRTKPISRYLASKSVVRRAAKAGVRL